MKLAILHHHLNRGGVTSVVANHLRALATLLAAERPERVVVLFDGQRDGWPDGLVEELSSELRVDLVVAPELAYDPPGRKADAPALAERLAASLASAGLSATDTLLHTHNHSLGKNASLPGALAELAESGWRLLLQVHDFAEDNRPENYAHLRDALGDPDADGLGQSLYPQAAGIHHATLTDRDAGVLKSARIPPKRLHTLPNPVAEFADLPSRDAARERVLPALGLSADTRLFVYPVRGIRRKNLGEMLLLAALAPDDVCFAVTLEPKNPLERGSFARWRRLADELRLPCRFDTGGPTEAGGHGCDFVDTLAAADAVLTTSVAEGFGMVFLEAWLAGRPLVGRDLPDITREFRDAGITFAGLYERLLVPADVFESPEAIQQSRAWEAAENRAAYGGEADAAGPFDVGSFAEGVIDPDDPPEAFDFGALLPGEQVELLRVAGELRETLLAANPGVAAWLAQTPEALQEEIDGNAGVVRRVYSGEVLARRLCQAYRAVCDDADADDPATGDAHPVRGAAVLKHFLATDRVWPVRIEAPTDEQHYESEATLEPLAADAVETLYEPYDHDSCVAALQDVILDRSELLEPRPTNESPHLPTLPGIRAVIYDVYGTLLVSASGDISLASEGSRGAAAADALAAVSVHGVDGDAVQADFLEAVRAAHAASPSEHPEVEIRDVWRVVLAGLGVTMRVRDVERLAVEYECRVNPVWPMPGLAETLLGIDAAGLMQGIVSNAQFFTPLAFGPLVGMRLEDFGIEHPEVCVWSYEHREAKPGTYLYERCAAGLAEHGITPSEALFVGNDLRNDVWPAARVGFKTALFAGDERSLRWRRDDSRLVDVRPDVVVTELTQLLGVIGIDSADG